MKHRLYIPIFCQNCSDENIGRYVADLRCLGADTVFLATGSEEFFRKSKWEDFFREQKKNVKAFRDAGFEVGLWTRSLGFGSPFPRTVDERFWQMERVTSVTGEVARDAFCPTDENYMREFGEWIRGLCRCAPDLLMLDDDLCLSVRPGIGCFCKNHRKLLTQALGWEENTDFFSSDAVVKRFFCGKVGAEREAYCRVMGDTLRDYCRYVRSAVDEIDPDLRVGFCAGYSSFDFEGADAVELTRILAGKNKPFLRLSGAPYWAAVKRMPGTSLADITEYVRLQNSVCPADWDVFHEADSFPRPRTSVPADLCEGYDLALRCEEGLGGLNYLFDYSASPSYETGYVKAHLRNQNLRGQIDRFFENAEPFGIEVIEGIDKVSRVAFPEEFPGEKPLMKKVLTRAGGFLATLGFPTVYGRRGEGAVCFGENAGLLVGKPLPRKLILDLPAALLLQKNGIDVGIESAEKTEPPRWNEYRGERTGTNVPAAYRARLKPEARIVSLFRDAEGEAFASAFTYAGAGTEFFVYAADFYAGDPRTTFSTSFFRQEELSEFFGHAFPLFERVPGIYHLCAKKETGEYVSLFLNYSEDTVETDEILTVGGEVTEVYGNALAPNGKGVSLQSPLPPYHGFLIRRKN